MTPRLPHLRQEGRGSSA